MSFEFVHQPGPEPTDLLTSSDGKEHNLSKPLSPKRAEDTSSQNMRLFALLFAHDDHGFVLPIHSEFHDVVAGHSRKLLGYDVLQLN